MGPLLLCYLVCVSLQLEASPAAQGDKRDARTDALTLRVPGRSVFFSLEDLRSMPRNRVTADRQGGRVTYEGVRILDLLRLAGVEIGRAPLRGELITSVLVVTAEDGFEAVFALAELDPADAQDRILIADRREGAPLSADEGPLRLIASADKYPVRWLRHVVQLKIVPKPR